MNALVCMFVIHVCVCAYVCVCTRVRSHNAHAFTHSKEIQVVTYRQTRVQIIRRSERVKMETMGTEGEQN